MHFYPYPPPKKNLPVSAKITISAAAFDKKLADSEIYICYNKDEKNFSRFLLQSTLLHAFGHMILKLMICVIILLAIPYLTL